MRISNFRHEVRRDTVRVSAAVQWEDSDLPAEDLCFEAEGVAPGEFVPSPEAFAIRGALAALHQNEKRVLVEGALCPRLRDGLRAALRTLRAWYSPNLGVPLIEATGGLRALYPPRPQAAVFLSCGFDSLFLLQSNRSSFPLDHPASYRVALFVPNFGALPEAFSSPRAVDFLARQRRSLERIAPLAGVRLMSVSDHSGRLGEDDHYFTVSSHGAHLAALAHLFPALSSASIAVSHDCTQLAPLGSHLLLDPNYSSSSLEIRHEGIAFTRLERVASVARWKEMLPHAVVCSKGPFASGRTNCGRCEKCLRTMIELLLSDSLSAEGPFSATDVDPSFVDRATMRAGSIFHWEPLPRLLRERGRKDLAAPAERLIARTRERGAWFRDRGWKGALRRLDGRFLGGRLLEASRRLRGQHRGRDTAP